jgi:hypothetical protein
VNGVRRLEAMATLYVPQDWIDVFKTGRGRKSVIRMTQQQMRARIHSGNRVRKEMEKGKIVHARNGETDVNGN